MGKLDRSGVGLGLRDVATGCAERISESCCDITEEYGRVRVMSWIGKRKRDRQDKLKKK